MSTRPRVLVVTPDFPPAKGGIQILSDRIVSSFKTLEPTVVTLGHPDAAEFDAQRDFRIVRAGPRPGARVTIFGLNATAVGVALRKGTDVVLSTHIVASPAAALLRHQLGTPFVQYVHAKEVGAKPSLAHFALSRADRVVAVSHYTRELAIDHGASLDRVVLVNPGVDVDAASSMTRARGERPTILTISRLEDRYKGHDVILRALPLIQSEVPAVQWRIVGDDRCVRPSRSARIRWTSEMRCSSWVR